MYLFPSSTNTWVKGVCSTSQGPSPESPQARRQAGCDRPAAWIPSRRLEPSPTPSLPTTPQYCALNLTQKGDPLTPESPDIPSISVVLRPLRTEANKTHFPLHNRSSQRGSSWSLPELLSMVLERGPKNWPHSGGRGKAHAWDKPQVWQVERLEAP